VPYKSDKQRAYLHIHHPEMAAKWDAELRSKKHKKRSVKRDAFTRGARKGAKLDE